MKSSYKNHESKTDKNDTIKKVVSFFFSMNIRMDLHVQNFHHFFLFLNFLNNLAYLSFNDLKSVRKKLNADFDELYLYNIKNKRNLVERFMKKYSSEIHKHEGK